jgi:hypothetical protein
LLNRYKGNMKKLCMLLVAVQAMFQCSALTADGSTNTVPTNSTTVTGFVDVNDIWRGDAICYIIQSPSNHTYQAKIRVESPFATAKVTQKLPDGVAILTTDGMLRGSSIVWTNIFGSSHEAEYNFSFSVAATLGAQTNLPPPTITFDNGFTLQHVPAYSIGLPPDQVTDPFRWVRKE